MIKKFGFTLAEILVTLTIIGIVAALIVPAISNLRPNKNKTAYLQVYDTISQTVKSLAANSRLYPVCNNPNVEDNVNCSQYPLLNTSRPLDNQYNNAIYQGDRKLCSLMALSLGVAEDDIHCSNTTYTFNAANYTNGFANESFVTKNGMRWRIVPQIATYTNNFEARFQNDIYVDIDPTNNNVDGEDRSCIFDEENCQNPDIFKFMVAANGRVVPADPKGDMYIKTRSNLFKKDKEIENQEIANQLDADRIFLYKKCDGTAGSPCSSDELWKDNIGCTDRWAEVKQCLRDIDWKTVTNDMTEFCGLKINRFEVVVSADAMTVKLLDGAAQASLTWKPWFFIMNYYNYYIYKTINPTSDFSCTIPVGGTTCSIPISEIREKAQEDFPNREFIIRHYSINHLRTPRSWFYIEETIRPFFDNTFLYKYKGSGMIDSSYYRPALTELSDFFRYLRSNL